MESSSPKKNFIYNLIYHVLILIIPLITTPYLSRIVGVEGVGIYSYTYSIVYYFMLLTLLGVNNYGNREIAKVRDDKEKLSKTFWSIFCLQLIMGIIMMIIYFVFVNNSEYKEIALIQSLYILSATFDINWFFFGVEEFKKTILRNSLIKIGSIALIFIFVKTEFDLWKYTLIMSGMTLLSQLILWFFLKEKVTFSKINISDVKKHIIPNISLFIPVIAISLYKMMDKIMLGTISNVTEVGLYDNAEKIINIPLTIITALGTVMLPRMTNIISKGEENKMKDYIYKSISFVMFLSFSMFTGLVGVSNHFAPMFFGSNFKKTGVLIILLSVTLPFMSFANVLRTQFLIPKEKDKVYIKSVFLGAFVNFILNYFLIPKFASIGACLGTIAAEIMVMLYQTCAVRKELPLEKYFISILPFFLKSLIMLIIIYPFNFLKINSLLRFLIQFILGISIYSLLNIKYIISLINIKKLKNNILKKCKGSI